MQAELENDYDLIARSAPGRGRPQVALAVRKDRRGDSIVVVEGEWIEAFPENFSFDKLRESSGAEEELTVTIDNFSRPVLHVQIQPQGRSPKPPVVSVYVAHLKSKGPARISFAAPQPKVLRHHAKIASSALSHIRRIMEAAAMRAMLDGVMKAEDEDEISPVVVLGDLNDDTQSVTNELLSDQPSYRLAEKSRAGNTSDKGPLRLRPAATIPLVAACLLHPISTRTNWKAWIIFWCLRSFMIIPTSVSGSVP